MKMKNVFTWVDIPTTDFDRAVKFYSEILGEDVKINDYMGQKLGFFPMEGDMMSGGVGGDIVPPTPDNDNRPSATGPRVYLSCEGRLNDAIGRVEKAGGKIMKPKFQIGDAGWIAFISDTEGNTIGLHSFK